VLYCVSTQDDANALESSPIPLFYLALITLCIVNDAPLSLFTISKSYFMAPEVFEEKYGSKADIWSVGGVIYQMLSGSPPWKNMGFKSPIALCMHLKSHDRPPKLPQLNDCNDLEYSLVDKILTACFQRDPSKRPSASELLSHPFLNNSIAHMPKSPGIMRRIATNSPSPSQSSCIDPFGESSDLAFKSPLNKIPEHEALNKSLTDSLCYSLSLQSPLPRFNTKTSPDTSSWPDWAKNRYDQENAGQNGTNPYAKKTPSQRTS
jgi:serine/threonine protein kinase